MTGYIYKITNLENDKIYIGQTSRNYKTRWREHINSAAKLKEEVKLKIPYRKILKIQEKINLNLKQLKLLILKLNRNYLKNQMNWRFIIYKN